MLGPLPTLCRFVALPLTQTATFVRTELLPFLNATPPSGADAGTRGETRVASAKGEEGEGGEEGEEGEGGYYSGAGRGGEAADLGAARPKGETAEAKRERKDAAKALKQARRHPNP